MQTFNFLFFQIFLFVLVLYSGFYFFQILLFIPDFIFSNSPLYSGLLALYCFRLGHLDTQGEHILPPQNRHTSDKKLSFHSGMREHNP